MLTFWFPARARERVRDAVLPDGRQQELPNTVDFLAHALLAGHYVFC